jgi:GNAT superfamily N-acetyltransferase
VAELAGKIWRQHFPSIIGSPQVEYMLEKFQSREAIASRMQQGMEYYLAMADAEAVGYAAVMADTENNKMMISKLYVEENYRKHGIGGQLLNFIEHKCLKTGCNKLWLTVNRFNYDPIGWYLGKDFEIVDELKQDIGGGFYMDDYIMEKRI